MKWRKVSDESPERNRDIIIKASSWPHCHVVCTWNGRSFQDVVDSVDFYEEYYMYCDELPVIPCGEENGKI